MQNVKEKICGEKTIMYSRVVGYFSPLTQWNNGMQEQWKNKKKYDIQKGAKENDNNTRI